MVAKPAIPRRFTSLVLRQTAQKVQRKKLRKKLKTCKPAPREDAESSFSITSSAHEVSAMDSPVVFGFFSDGERCHSSDHLWDDLWNEDGVSSDDDCSQEQHFTVQPSLKRAQLLDTFDLAGTLGCSSGLETELPQTFNILNGGKGWTQGA
eukprot:EG_transcript_39239